ncbi:unnamed protein product [Allacma fusca]|uniref:Uncharacterized protein n=1 Tax=Allacma fusca TaxID=39272 RepID=A0A8J2KCZ1_9HEXA|nr:unnamed protein product [Allacma fusca]
MIGKKIGYLQLGGEQGNKKGKRVAERHVKNWAIYRIFWSTTSLVIESGRPIFKPMVVREGVWKTSVNSLRKKGIHHLTSCLKLDCYYKYNSAVISHQGYKELMSSMNPPRFF